ncbi:(2Fe-2S)-binding protein [Streptomyces sp. ISL-66]|uniref:(2Fe-2S)-binding protein n=1 Tax=Streptomyces sp. ISL-66 TaxID=2819186 RepID=UPI001BEBCD4F|nr:(2Fe-2S)-binding protein [Streptomyces sp. ISL-66]MBT2468854.1 (2Fe-2S)-binding protein [Streptomyces sp. ISL-66]
MPETQLIRPCAVDLPGGTYRRLTERSPGLHVELTTTEPPAEAGRDWISVADLDRCHERLIAEETARIQAGYDCVPRRHVAASRLLHHYLWSLCLLVSGPWYLDRRVPRIRPEDVWIDSRTGDLALRPGDFACLAGDLAAGLPGVRVLAGEDELRAELRAVVAEHVTPLLAVFQSALKRGPRALWGMVTDDLVSGIWHLGRMLCEEDAAVRAAGAVLPGDTPPFPGAASFRRLPGTDGRTHQTRTRLGCCLYYAIRPAEACVTCPRTSDAERVRRLERQDAGVDSPAA